MYILFVMFIILFRRFCNPEVHPAVISLLEFFEIIYKIRGIGEYFVRTSNAMMNDEQMFFVPSLLSPFDNSIPHPSLQYWQSINPTWYFCLLFAFVAHSHFSLTYKRIFTWKFFPNGFFPRLLLRLAHLRFGLLACWLDAAVIVGKGAECAFLRLFRELDQMQFKLEV